MPRLRITSVSLAAALAAAGCGSASSGPKDAVAQFFTAIRNGDGAKACSLLTPEAQKQAVTGSQSCPASFNLVASLLKPQLAHLSIGDATVNGNTAEVSVSTPSKHTVYSLQNVGDRWLISKLR